MSEFVFAEAGNGGLKFVGDFDGLYASEADPWGQSGFSGALDSYYEASRNRVCASLVRHAPEAIRGGLEIGCGHGYALPRLRASYGGMWSGLDISAEAIARARVQKPTFDFYVGDIAAPTLPFPPSFLGRWDVTLFSECLWYVLERIDAAVGNATRLCRLGGLVIVSQAFLRGEQRYGADIADGFHGVLKLFTERYPGLTLIEAFYDDTEAHAHHHGLMIFRKVAHHAQ